MKFIIISSAFNEALHIRKTLDSITKQTILPNQWIIVDDGSTDGTSEIVKEYASKYGWINLVTCEKEPVEFGTHAVVNFYKGLRFCTISDWQFVMKLDADLDIDKIDFFEYQLNQFIENKTLGICSGITYSIINGEKVFTKGRPYWRTGGAMKFYRRECLEQMGGLSPIYGWDGLDEYKAMFHGWKTRTFFNLPVNHLGKKRANNRNQNKLFFEKRGKSFYQRGYPIEFIFLKTLSYFVKSPTKSIYFLKGFLNALFNKEKTFVTPEEKKFIRKIQYVRIADSLTSKNLL